MRNWAIGAGLLFLLGCNRGGLPAGGGDGGGAPKPMDLATVSHPADLALPVFDLANPCHLTMPNATTVLDGHTLAYAWLGNVDQGGESNCGGPPEGVLILLAEEPTPDGFTMRASFVLSLPVQLGTQSVKVFTKIGGQREADATLEVTGFTSKLFDQCDQLRGSGCPNRVAFGQQPSIHIHRYFSSQFSFVVV